MQNTDSLAFTKANNMRLANQHILANDLLAWHGGQSSGLYAVGSCMLSDCVYRRLYSPKNHYGHENAILRAIDELRKMKRDAKFPEAVRSSDERACNALANKLEAINAKS